MRNLLLYSLFLLLSTSSFATNYYLSNNGNDNQSGTSPNTAWRSIDKLNARITTIGAGDTIFFRRGDIFRGEIIHNTNGAKGNPTVYSAYGTGDLPVITGAVALNNNWTVHSGNIWKRPTGENIKHLFADGDWMTPARYPNQGFLTVANGGLNFVTCTALNQPNNYWKNGYVRGRTTKWTYEYQKIASSSSNGNLQFAGSYKYDMKKGWGFFISHVFSELDMPGEWYYDTQTEMLYFWAPNNVNPNNLDLQGAVFDFGITGFSGKNRSFVSIFNLEFRHQVLDGIKFSNNNTEEIMVRDCRFLFQGETSITMSGTNLDASHNYFEGAMGRAVKGNRVVHGNFTHNTVRWVGMEPGYGISGNQGMNGFHFTNADQIYCAYNVIDTVGYTGISCYTTNSVIEKNIINGACLKLDDGGAIYNWGSMSNHTVIANNFIYNVPGNAEGVGKIKYAAHGIYMDFKVSNMTIINNTIVNVERSGIFLNSENFNQHVEGNVIYDPKSYGIWVNQTVAPNKTRNNTIVNNQVFAFNKETTPVRVLSLYGDEKELADFDSNYFINPHNDYFARLGSYSSMRWYTEEEWDETFPGMGALTNIRAPFQWDGYDVVGYLSGNLISNGKFDQNGNDWKTSNQTNLQTTWMANGGLDGGCMRVRMTSNNPKTRNFYQAINGGLKGGSFYQVNFSILSNLHGTMKLRLKQGNTALGTTEFPITTGVRDYTQIFEVGQNAQNADLVFEIINEDGSMFILDNIEIKEVDVTPHNPKHKAQVFSNQSDNPKNIPVPAGYVDLDGNPVSGSITLAPYTSRILVGNGQVQAPGDDPVAKMTVTPASGIAPLVVEFDGTLSTDSDGTIQSFAWDFGNGTTATGPIASYTYTTGGFFTATLTVTDNDGLTNTVSQVIQVSSGNCTTPANWVLADIGSIGSAGAACEDLVSGALSLTSTGEQLYGPEDGFTYLYQTLVGNGMIEAQITGLDSTNDWTLAGVMIRGTTDFDSKYVMMGLNAEERWVMQHRNKYSNPTIRVSGNAGASPKPHWVRLVRTGTVFDGYESIDGITWNHVGTENVNMANTITIGLALTSNDVSTASSGYFSNVNLNSENTFPVTLDFFQGEYQGDQVQLSWGTESELNNDFFTIERSADGQFFEPLGSVIGNGTTNQPSGYQFLDTNPVRGRAYYRLKQTDFDGQFNYLSTIEVNFEQSYKARIKVFPNPTQTGDVQISFSGASAQEIGRLKLIDAQGRVVMEIQPEAQSFYQRLPESLSPGAYYLIGHFQQQIIRAPLIKL